LFSGSFYIFFAYLVLVMAFPVRSRPDICAAFLVMAPMLPYLHTETEIGGIYLFPFSTLNMIGLGALIGFLFAKRIKTQAKPYLDVLAFLLVALISYIDVRDMTLTGAIRYIIDQCFIMGVPYLLFSRGIATEEQRAKAFLTLLLAAVMASLVAIFQTTRHWILYQTLHAALDVPIALQSWTLMMRGGLLRTGGPMLSYGVFGIFVAIALVTLMHYRYRFRPLGFWVLNAVLFGGLMATQSRGAWLATFAGYTLLFAYRGYVVRVAAVASLGGLAAIIVPLLVPANSRLGETIGLGGASQGTNDYRVRLLERGIEEIAAHPLSGQTPTNLENSMIDMMQGQHIVDFVNTHLYMGMTTGVIGLLLWITIWSAPVLHCWTTKRGGRAARSGPPDPCELPVLMILVPMVALTFTSFIDRNPLWPSIALGMVGPCLALRAQRRQSRATGSARSIYGRAASPAAA